MSYRDMLLASLVVGFFLTPWPWALIYIAAFVYVMNKGDDDQGRPA